MLLNTSWAACSELSMHNNHPGLMLLHLKEMTHASQLVLQSARM